MQDASVQLGSVLSLHGRKPWGEKVSRIRELLDKINPPVRRVA